MTAILFFLLQFPAPPTNLRAALDGAVISSRVWTENAGRTLVVRSSPTGINNKFVAKVPAPFALTVWLKTSTPNLGLDNPSWITETSRGGGYAMGKRFPECTGRTPNVVVTAANQVFTIVRVNDQGVCP